MVRKKVSIIGAGYTGTTTAFLLAQKELCDVVLLDVSELENPTIGKALDILESMPVLQSDSKVLGTIDYSDTLNSDVVIITAGVARKPGMSRDDLVQTNQKIVQTVTKQVVRYSPSCIIVVLTNPVDAMTFAVYKNSGFSKSRVFGQSGILDSARFRTFIAQEINMSVKDITGFVLGGHGDDMVPLVRYSFAGGIPIEKLIPKNRIDAIVERTRKGGGEIVNLLGNGSAYYAPSAAILEIVEAILKDQRRVFPASAYLEGEYGFNDLYLGVPTVIGVNGIERIIELDLLPEEKFALEKSAKSVKEVICVLT